MKGATEENLAQVLCFCFFGSVTEDKNQEGMSYGRSGGGGICSTKGNKLTVEQKPHMFNVTLR